MNAVLEAAPRALAHAAGLDLDAYREEHVRERIARAVAREGVASVGELARRIGSDASARERFRRSVAVSVSGLFRDADQFDLLERELLPPLLAGDRRFRVWSVGCADGSELYSVAIVLDRLGGLERSFLLGSDVLEENIVLARRGVYGEVSISQQLRSRARWERRDAVSDGPPQGKWGLILCRNVAIYFTADAKRSLFSTLAGSLATNGLLMLGRSERLTHPESFDLERVAPHVYQRTV
jgi:chemotaxis protein methyltransferase CheR